MTDVATGSFVQQLAPDWWALLLRGIVALVFGLVALFSPAPTLLALVLLFGIYAVADGVLAVVAGIRGTSGHRWLLILEGIVGVLAGVVAFARPGTTAVVLLYVAASWAVLTGILEIVAAVRLRREMRGEWLMALGGGLSVLVGLILAASPGPGLLSLVWLLGIYALLFGLALIVLAFRVRSYRQTTGGRVS